MKPETTAKIGIGIIGVSIIGYGLYSMKKDTEKFLNAPGDFLGGILGGSGLPESLEKLPENVQNIGNTAKSSFVDGLVDGLSVSMGLGKPPSAATPNLKTRTPQGTNVADIKTHQQAVTMGLGMAPLAINAQSDFKKSTDIYFPVLEAGPTTKYTEKTSNSSSSYTDSTGRVYTPTNTIKARW